jgi:hypothetical protein
MPRAISEEDRPTEDDIAREKLGARGVPGRAEPRQNDAATAKENAEIRRLRRAYGLAGKFNQF